MTAAIALTALLASVTTPVLSAAAAGPAPAPLLVGSETLAGGAGAAGSMDLTALGTLGWVHADGSGTETKASASDPLELTNLHPDTPLATLTDSPIAFSWSDGAGTASAEGVTTGAVYRYDLSTVGDTTAYDAGYRLTVPAADSVRQVVLVSGIWQADARFSVTTLDGTAVYGTQLSAGGSASVKKTTVTLRPGEGAVISATLRAVHGRDGNVSFMGAALRSLESGPQLATGPVPSTMDLTAEGALDWLHLDGATMERSADGDGSLGVANRDASGTINQQGDNPATYSWSNGTTVVQQPGTRTGGVFLARTGDFAQPWGWDLTVASAPGPRTLRFVAGAWQATAQLTVTLDGATTPVLTDGSLSAGGAAVSYLYTVSIPAGSSAKISTQLTNTTEANGNGNVTLAGVTLAEQDFHAALSTLVQQAEALDASGAEPAIADQLDAETEVAKALLADAGAPALDVQREVALLQAAVAAATASSSGAQYTYQTNPGLTASFGWEGDKDAPIAFIDGSYRLRDHGNTIVTFGVPDIPGKIGWRNAEGYLPAFISTYAKGGLEFTIQSFSDEVTVGGNRFEVAYSRMTTKNTTAAAATLPRVSTALVPLNGGAAETTVAAGATVVRDYAIGADRFGNTYAWPTDAQLQALGSYDEHYSHMRDYWNGRLSAIADITALPDARLINAYKAGYIYTLLIRDDVNGQKQLHVGENGYDEMFDHDTIGIVSNLLNLGDFTYAKDYLATLPAQLQYQDAKWKYSVPYAIYLQRTGDEGFVRDHFDVIKTNTHTISSDREDGGTGIIKITNAIDSDGHWTVDNWSALYGLSTYKYLAEKLGDPAEAAWAQSEYDSLMAAANAKLDATRAQYGLGYIPMAMDQPNESGPRSDPRDANWASMFLFGGWAWDSYLYGMPQSGSMLTDIDKTYAYGIDRRKGVSDSPYNFGGYPHGFYSSAYNAGYGGAALRGEQYRDIGIKAYEFMIDHSQSGPFGWWEGVAYPSDGSPWDIAHASGGGGSDQHMWGQAMNTKMLFDSLVSLASDGSLIIGRGVPTEWVADGKKVALDDFPVSDGGRIGYAMEAKKNTVALSFSGDLDKVPGISVQLMALKDNIASVNVKGAKVDAAAGTISLPKGTTKVTIKLGHPVLTATKQPSISGKPVVGSTLTAKQGTWTAQGASFAYRWLRDGRPIEVPAAPAASGASALAAVVAQPAAAATGATYTPTAADAGHAISVRVTASLAGYDDGTATSAAVRIAAAAGPGGGGDGGGAGGGGASGGAGGASDPAATGSGDGVLASTGSDAAWPLGLLAAALIAVGAVAFGVRRSRRA
ncbi:hypothetical protein P5G50_04710 [Leifsonia sp. F6_8S_P_1B]|uniref:Sugar-binding protein n=1 Tax=Leifsonia williamsii TaxID=3035919 RepID=A0ABT8K8F0_9MICO|nr:hypothetical protein [Leifsonia williamsii]MDN4613748.1 hypothetical protein [Leifsonia williamsii]